MPDEFDPILQKIGEIEDGVKSFGERKEKFNSSLIKLKGHLEELEVYKDEYVKLTGKSLD
jgi:hypothetical protein